MFALLTTWRRMGGRFARAAWWSLSLVLALACTGEHAAQDEAVADSAPAASTAAVTSLPSTTGFRTLRHLDEHFAKHGAEFGSISREEYLRQAQMLRDAPVGGDVLEIRRGDGTVSRFDRVRGSFIAFDADGIIRTFFKPNDGEQYFRRQARRRASP